MAATVLWSAPLRRPLASRRRPDDDVRGARAVFLSAMHPRHQQAGLDSTDCWDYTFL